MGSIAKLLTDWKDATGQVGLGWSWGVREWLGRETRSALHYIHNTDTVQRPPAGLGYL